MTDKQTIIDGVDVSGCEYFYLDRDGEPGCCESDQTCPCNAICGYAAISLRWQLARKEQECEEIFVKTYQMWMYYISNGINNASDLTIQYLLEDIGKVTKMLAALCDIKNNTLRHYAGQALDETNRYKQGLEKIEKYIKTQLDANGNDVYSMDKAAICKILDIINEAKNV